VQRRRKFSLGAALWLLVLAAMAGLWVRSLWRVDLLIYAPRGSDRAYRLECSWGELTFSREDASLLPVESGYSRYVYPQPRGQRWRDIFQGEPLSPWNYLGFGYRNWTSVLEPTNDLPPLPPWVTRALILPIWLAMGLWIAAAALPRLAAAQRRRRRLRRGLCPMCGYDLRATPNRCPECGHVVQCSTSRTLRSS
jgi:hypothetical protein